MVTTKANQVVEVEVCAPSHRKLFFRPIGRSVRGRVAFSAESQHASHKRWPEPVPGIVLGVNLATGETYLRDPIFDPEQHNLRQTISERGYRLPPEREEFSGETPATWVFWLQRAVEAGLARVIKGELPDVDSLEGEPRRHFITAPPRRPDASMADALKAMAGAIQENTRVLSALAERLTK